MPAERKRLAGRQAINDEVTTPAAKVGADPREQRNTETAAHARINARKEMTAAPSHIQAHGRDRRFEDPCRQKNERAGFRPTNQTQAREFEPFAGKQHVGQNGSDSMIRPATVGFCDNGERSIFSHVATNARNNAADPSNTAGERARKAMQEETKSGRTPRAPARERQPARASEKRRGCRSPPNAASAALKYSTVFRRAAQLVSDPGTSSGALSTPATMPASGVPNMAATLAAIVASPIAQARRPARLRRSRSRQHADAMRPVKPASGPTEPPNTIGSKKPTTTFPLLPRDKNPSSLNDAMTVPSGAGALGENESIHR